MQENTKTSRSHKPFSAGVHLKGDKLYVFTRQDAIVLRAWSHLRAWRKTPFRRWRCIRPSLRLAEDHIAIGKREAVSALSPVYLIPLHIVLPSCCLQDDMACELPENAPVPLDRLRPPSEREKLLEQLAERDQARLRQFFSMVPSDILKKVSRFGDRHWHLLRFCSLEPAAVDLMESHPALAYGVASSWVFRKVLGQPNRRFLLRLLARPQRAILAWLGLGSSEADVRAFKKLLPGHCSVSALFGVGEILRAPQHDGWREHLRHVPVISRYALYLILCHPQLATPSLVSDLATLARHEGPEDRGKEFFNLLRDVLSMKQCLEPWTGPISSTLRKVLAWKLYRDPAPAKLRTIDGVQKVHDMMVALVLRMDGRQPEPVMQDFPDPPLPGNDHIVPILNSIDLRIEGQTQHNCVATYTSSAAWGELAIYRMLAPQRATLSVVQNKATGRWEIGEIKARYNQVVAPETRQVAETWCLSAQRQKPSLAPRHERIEA